MTETKKPVIIERVSPANWVAKDKDVESWSKHLYQFTDNKVVEYEMTEPKLVTIFNVWEPMDWMDYWFNFFYNTNSVNHNIELIPYEGESYIVV